MGAKVTLVWNDPFYTFCVVVEIILVVWPGVALAEWGKSVIALASENNEQPNLL